MRCAICKVESTYDNKVFKLPNILSDLGIEGEFAHPSCAIRAKEKVLREADRRGLDWRRLANHR